MAGLSAAFVPEKASAWHWRLTPLSTREKKRFDSFLEEKKVQKAQNKKESEIYQEEIKKRLKLVTMIGGQIYKRISDRMNSKQAAK
jgi:hypothetical protein